MIAAFTMALAFAGCAGGQRPATVNPCGVLRDSLIDVQGKRLSDTQRIDAHYQRGRGAACWK
jgi:hypothetical protein